MLVHLTLPSLMKYMESPSSPLVMTRSPGRYVCCVTARATWPSCVGVSFCRIDTFCSAAFVYSKLRAEYSVITCRRVIASRENILAPSGPARITSPLGWPYVSTLSPYDSPGCSICRIRVPLIDTCLDPFCDPAVSATDRWHDRDRSESVLSAES